MPVEFAGLQKLRMGAVSYPFAVVEYDYAVGVFQHGQTVRDDDHRAVFGNLDQILPHYPLTFRIERTGRLIEEKNRVRRARAMASRCRCPPDRFFAPSSSMVS